MAVHEKTVYKALKKYMDDAKPDDNDYLFLNYKGKNALTIQTINNMITKWAKKIDLKSNYGAHTLRKTFGYIQRTELGVGFEVLWVY